MSRHDHLPHLRLRARYRILISGATGSFRKLARWIRLRLLNRQKHSDEEYEEPWVRDMVERS